jgi:hypothetical protein
MDEVLSEQEDNNNTTTRNDRLVSLGHASPSTTNDEGLTKASFILT